jgi:hypothetical protein
VAPNNGLDQGNTKTFPNQTYFTSNGAQNSQSNFLLNGGNNLDELTNINAPFPFPDALQEFSVQTSNYSAEYGQSAGAVVNIVTKSGGRQFHGDAFEFIRNGYFDAKPYFASTADSLHRNQFGGTIGGPVIIPHISTGARTQFFFGFQKTIYHLLSGANSATVPTLAEEGRDPTSPGYGIYGDFGSACTAGFNGSGICANASQQINDPFHLTGGKPTPWPYNRIPASRFDPASVAFEKDIPTPPAGTTALGSVITYELPTIENFNEYLGRVDHSFGDKDHLFGHYYYNDFAIQGIYNPANLLDYGSVSNIRYQNALLSEDHTFTSSVLNNLTLNYQRETSLRGGPPGSPNVNNFGVNIWQPPQNNVIYSTSVANYFTVSGYAYAYYRRNNYTFNDNLHWVKGSHNIGFGGHIELSKWDLYGIGYDPGGFAFNSTNTATSSSNTAASAASFQMGYLFTFEQGGAQWIADRNHFPGLYAEDSWKVNTRLTVDYGLRWEDFAPWTDKAGNGGMSAFLPSNYASGTISQTYTNLPAGMVVSGDPGFNKNGVANQYHQFMPRVGFSYALSADGKTVVRGGAGIFYEDRLQAYSNASQSFPTLSVAPGTTGGTSLGGPFSNPYCTGCTANSGTAAAGGATAGPLPDPFPITTVPSNYKFPTPETIREYGPTSGFKVPVMDDYNLTVEHQLASNLALRVAYVGSVSRHNLVSLEINPGVNNGGPSNVNYRRPYNTSPTVGPCTTTVGCNASYSNIVEASMSGSGSYNSLQATLDKKMSRGLSFMFNYTWSKSMDDLPYQLGVGNIDNLEPNESYVYPVYPAGASSWNPTNFKALDIGPSDFDHTNVLSFSYVYSLPNVHEGNSLVKGIANGWKTTGLIQRRSGDRITPVITSNDVSLTGLFQDRAQLTGAPIYTRKGGTGNCAASTAHCINWLSPGGVSVPINTGPGTGFGDAQKSSFVGPAVTNWDAAVIRSFPLYRETNLEFRAEYFDVLNHVELSDPTTNPTSGSYGNISSTAGGPRIGEFSLKITF